MFKYFVIVAFTINVGLILFFLQKNRNLKAEKEVEKILSTDIIQNNSPSNSITFKTNSAEQDNFHSSNNRLKSFSNLYKKHQFLNCRSKGFWKNSLVVNLKKNHPKLKIYVLIEFEKNITPPVLDFIYENYRFKIFKSPYPYYLKKKKQIFKGAFINLKYLVKYKEIKKISLLKKYPIKGFYSLRLSTRFKPNSPIQFQISIPKSISGISFSNFKYRIHSGRNKIIATGETNQLFYVNVSLKKKSFLTYYSHFYGMVNIGDYLRKTVATSGKNITLEQYQQWIKNQTNENLTLYTNFSDKIDYSDLVERVNRMIKKEKSIASSVKYIIKKLDDEIKYDFRKRKLFFSGNLTYTNIRDMYLKCSELTEKKIGACPEQSSLEIATLRSLGILSRSATRLYHIYAEVYLPNVGWVSTSPELDEIKLIESQDEKQSYFIDWQPNHPIDIKWKGEIYPEIIDYL